MKTLLTITLAIIALPFLVLGCDRVVEPSNSSHQSNSINDEIAELEMAARQYAPVVTPDPLVTEDFNGQSLTFWPYTGNDFTGEGHDPINLIFIGKADPRDIRAALLSLDGDRTAYNLPDVAPLNSVWDDAIGDVQSGYGSQEGWTASCIQLECGDHLTIRFHLRLFDVGDYTLANCHFEFLIPGTSEHQVLSWELAEQLVMIDFMRSGLLDPDLPMMSTSSINPSPYQTIPAMVYNELPVELRLLIGGPPGDVGSDVPIVTDGQATILNLVQTVEWQPEIRQQDFYINFGQVIPKPFCSSGPGEYVLVSGPVHLVQTSELTEGGKFLSNFHAEGELSVTPADPNTGDPIGETLSANVIEFHRASYSGEDYYAYSLQYQKLLPAAAPGAGRLFTVLRADSRENYLFYARIECEWGIDETSYKPAVNLLTTGMEER